MASAVPAKDVSPLRSGLARRALLGLALQAVLRLRGLLLIPVLVRVLPPAEVGVLNLGNAFTGWITPMLLLGINTGYALRLVHLTRPTRPAVLTVLLFSSVVSIFGVAVIFAAVKQGFLGSALSPLVPVLLPLGLLAIATAAREVATVFPQVRQDLRFIAGNGVLMDFGGVLLAIAFVLAGYGAYGALLGPALLSLVGASIAAAYSLRRAEGPFALDRPFLASALRSALPVVPLALALWSLQSSDYLVISYFHGTGALAIYGLAYSLASPTLMALAAVNLTFLPTCVEILARGRKEFARFIDHSTRLFALAGIAAVSFSVASGPALTTWFAGPDYAESGYLLPVVVGAYVLFSLSQLQQLVPGTMTQDLSGAARVNILAAGFNLAANFLVVPDYGYWGAAWATMVAYGLSLFLMMRGNRLLLPEITWPRIAGRLTAIAFVSSGLALLLRPLATGVITALSAGVLSVIGLMVLAWTVGLITREDRARLSPARRPN